MNECLQELVDQAAGIRPAVIELVNAAQWIDETPPPPDQILENVVDLKDKMVIIAPSKMRKSFLVLQMALALASHPKFLGWIIPKKRRVLYIQLEIQEHHCWRRVRNLARAMGICSDDLGDRLMIVSGRGLGIKGAAGLERIKQAIADFKPEVIIIDPIYKISEGIENAAEDFKVLLGEFDKLAEDTGAAIFYVHHDTKGSAGDRDIRDRGAGSNVLGRDYDACVTLTQHATEPEGIVVDMLLRNYAPQEPFTIVWEQQQDTGGYCFSMADDLMASKRTSKTRAAGPTLETYLPTAAAILIGKNELEISYFKALFQEKTGLGDNKIKHFMSWATQGRNPPMRTREERGYKLHRKWVSMAEVN
jgi:hypothetical protein